MDDVWPLCYARKEKSVQFLTESGQFYENEDYTFSPKGEKVGGVFRENEKNPVIGRPSDKYMLSVPCMEYLIARKVRAVFEVYRVVFHEFMNAKSLSDDEIVLQAMLIQQRRIEQKKELSSKQAKAIAKLKNQLESEKHQKAQKRLDYKTRADKRIDELVSEWLSNSNTSGIVSMRQLFGEFCAFCSDKSVDIYISKARFGGCLRRKGCSSFHKRDGSWYNVCETTND